MLNIIDENYIYIDAFFYSFWMKKNEYNKYKHQTLKEFYEKLLSIENNTLSNN